MEMRLNDDLLQLMTDASEAWWTVTDALQNLHITILRVNMYHYLKNLKPSPAYHYLPLTNLMA